ncbi:acetyl-CoA acetyltransferase [Clostridia bacterium]|nr:acetyl-CoA acetyltransferase [Clostridia bacterium]
MKEVVIVSTARTPIGDLQGSLKTVEPVELGKIAAKGAIERSGVDRKEFQELATGMLYKHGHKGNPARQIQLGVGLPEAGYSYTIDQQCASGMKAVELITESILLGKTDVGLAIGLESMTKAPYLLKNAREGYRLGNGPEVIDTILQDGLICAMEGYHMGLTAENLASEYGITREEQDELALLSHQRAIAAQDAGKFDEEIVPVVLETRKGRQVIDKDEHPRRDISLESLAKLRPAFKKDGGTVTAGNASGVNDAAAALVLMSADKARELGVTPLARVVSTANFGVEPRIMGIGPAYAIPKALDLAGLKPDDIGYYEINEAFAAQFLACNRELKLDLEKVNANGSGIGLGHPVGCTGARIIVALIHELKRRGEQYGVASLCVGGGPAMAVVVENI